MSSEDQYLESFNNFIKQLKIIFTDDETHKILDSINNYTNEKKIYNGLLFSSLMIDEYFDLFINSKIKLFSHKNPKTQELSESLFGTEFCLKNILNNQPDDVKKVIWFNLHSIFSTIEKTKSEEIQNKSKLEIVDKLIYIKEEQKPKINISVDETKNKLQEMLDVTVNDETSGMIDDIIKSFETIINNPKGGNPLSGIMEISQKISSKYSEKITNGDIEIDKLMGSITKKVPGLDKMMSGMNNGSGNIKDMMSGMMGGNKKEVKETVLIDENFSTSNVSVGVTEEKPSNNIKIGNILKIADQFGVIPGSKKSDNKESSEGQGLPSLEGLEGIPNLGKIMEIMQKLDKSTTPGDADNLKEEMNTFLKNDLGIDMSNFTEQIEEMSKKMAEDTIDKVD
jgi:hypothetical protein